MITKDRVIARRGGVLAVESDAPMAKDLYETYARVSDRDWRNLSFSDKARWFLVAARVRQRSAR